MKFKFFLKVFKGRFQQGNLTSLTTTSFYPETSPIAYIHLKKYGLKSDLKAFFLVGDVTSL